MKVRVKPDSHYYNNCKGGIILSYMNLNHQAVAIILDESGKMTSVPIEALETHVEALERQEDNGLTKLGGISPTRVGHNPDGQSGSDNEGKKGFLRKGKRGV